MIGDSITVTAPGAVINFGAASANVAIPNTSGGVGNLPKYVRLVSTQPCYVRITNGAGVAVAGDLMVQPADSVVVRSHGLTHVNAIQVTAAGVLQISPCEDQ